MNFWWVNQNQTFAQESDGGYLWSPKRNILGHRNPFYEFMRDIAPGDVIFSFAKTRIQAIAIAQTTAYGAPKPAEFGTANPNWSNVGWKITVRYFELTNRIRPADHMFRLGPLMPKLYAPLQASGRGNQRLYITYLSTDLAHELLALIGEEARAIVRANRVAEANDAATGDSPVDILHWEEHVMDVLKNDTSLSDTEREAVVLARCGQGAFKRNVQKIETRCRITGVTRQEHLIASHCKPWRDCKTHEERISGDNGLLLTPSIDHLFDRGLISFEDHGELLISPVAHGESLRRMGVPVESVTRCGSFGPGQRSFLEYHRQNVFLQSNR